GAADAAAVVRHRHRADQLAGGYAICDGGEDAGRQPGGAVFGGSSYGIGAGRVCDRGGDGDSADDVAPGSGERLFGPEEDADVFGADRGVYNDSGDAGADDFA